jgi:competence protein ComEC
MRPHHFSYIFLTTFLLTIFFLQWWIPPWHIFGVLGTLGLLVLLWNRNVGLIGISLALGISTALFAVSRTTHIPSPRTIDWHANGSSVEIIGTIAREPDRRPLKTKYTIQTHTIDNTPITGLVLVTDHTQQSLSYGDTVTVTGKLEKPGRIEDFHYDKYLSRYGIYSVIYHASIKENSLVTSDFVQEKQPHGNPGSLIALNKIRSYKKEIFKGLYTLKHKFETQINNMYPEPHASFLAGLLTGSRKGIPSHLLENFNATGLTHIIAISGYNITIILSIITGLLFWLPLKKRLIPSVIAITLFTILVGAEASVVRAAIMGTLGLLALQVGRQSHTRLAILWTLCVMLLYNPKYLWYDAGFQLSFLAVIGLTELSTILSPLSKRLPEFFGIREALQMTISAQLFAVPWIINLFGRLSLIAPIANILAAFPIPFAMLFGFLSVITSFVWFPLGQLFGILSFGCLDFVIWIANTLANIPYASIHVPSIGITFMIGYYLLLIVSIMLIKKKNNPSAYNLKPNT